MSFPIRVLHAVVNMNRGGAETLIMNLYRNLDRSKVQFDFLTSKEGVLDAEILELGGRIHRIPYITDIGHFEYINSLNNFFILHNDYKIVHSHMDKMSGFVLRAAKRAGVPIRIAHSHSTKSEGGIAARLYKWYAGLFIQSCATNFVACSDRASKWLFKTTSRKSVIVKNGIDLKKFAFSDIVRNKVRKNLDIDQESTVVGHVGRFCHAKNHRFLIDIFDKYAKFNSNSVLILAGDGPLRAEIQHRVAELDLVDKVKFLGVRNDIDSLLQAFDIFVFPSLYEGLPVTLIEAQGAGVPCVISDRITKEVDLGVDLIGYLPLNDTRVWVEKIKTALNRISTKSTTVVLRKKGYDIQHVSEWVQNFYLNLSR